MIHPTAIIDPAAQLAPGVEVGPYAIIGADVSIGEGTVIGPHAIVRGPATIGRDNHIFQFTSIGEAPQDKKYHGEVTRLEIGDRNIIREFTTVHRGTLQDQGITRIGSDNLLMAYAHVAHDCVIGDGVIMANAASLAGHVHVQDHAILGGFSLVHQFCKIGAYSFAAMGSVVTRDVPPYVMIGGRPTRPHGINSVGLERKGFSPEAVRQIKKAYKVLYKAGFMLDEAIRILDDMSEDQSEVGAMADFLKASGRSILR